MEGFSQGAGRLRLRPGRARGWNGWNDEGGGFERFYSMGGKVERGKKGEGGAWWEGLTFGPSSF